MAEFIETSLKTMMLSNSGLPLGTSDAACAASSGVCSKGRAAT